MGNFYSKNYWSIGFQSKLYDWLSPESYFESMRRVVSGLPDEKSIRLLDAGCGSGLLLRFLEARINQGMIYTGIDLLKSGVDRALLRAQEMGITDRVSCFQHDLNSPLPKINEKFDVVVGHFCLYTLATDESRQLALEYLKSAMKPEGVLILVNPSSNYDADSIIDHSVQLIRERDGSLASLIKKLLIYPFTNTMGLRFIQKQLRLKKWKGYTREEFTQELESGGFEILYLEEVYAGSAFLGIGKLRETSLA
jgi:SAM-dependent methyltransferase